MLFRTLIAVCLLCTSALCCASDGVIRFAGQVYESTCTVQTGKTETVLNACSTNVAASSKVTTHIMTPNAHMLVWRANDTSKPDAPVTQWKITEVTYR